MMMKLVRFCQIVRPWSAGVVSFLYLHGTWFCQPVAGAPRHCDSHAARFARARQGRHRFSFIGAGGGIGPPPGLFKSRLTSK